MARDFNIPPLLCAHTPWESCVSTVRYSRQSACPPGPGVPVPAWGVPSAPSCSHVAVGPCSPAWHRGLNVERGAGHSQGMLMGARSLTGACALLSQTRCHKPALSADK